MKNSAIGKFMKAFAAFFANRKKSKFRFGSSTGKDNRKRALEENPLLLFAPKHSFKPVRRFNVNPTLNGHNYKRLLLRMRLGKLKPKQLAIANYKIESAGITLND